MAYLAKIQYKYNDLLQNIRDDLGSDIDKSYYTDSFIKETLKDFKKTFDKAVKPFPADVKMNIQFKFLPMLQHIAILLDDLKNDPASVEDELSYHYQFDQDGELRKIPHQPIIRETIEELPRLTRLARQPDTIIDKDTHSMVIDIPMVQHEATPEADIQNLYDEFVGQINANLASLGDIKEYPNLLSELYQLIRTQIYVKDRPRILKKLKQMVAQLDDLAYKLSRDPSAQYTISPIHLTDKIKGMYPEEKKTYTQKIVKSKQQKLIRLGNEDLPILERDVVDFFEQIPAQKEPEPEFEPEPVEPRKRKIHKYKVEATLRPERKSKVKTDGQAVLVPKGRKVKKEKEVFYDETDISKYTIPQLKDFMRQRRLRGLSGKKSELVAIVQAYLDQN
jgi:hypothetical protein